MVSIDTSDKVKLNASGGDSKLYDFLDLTNSIFINNIYTRWRTSLKRYVFFPFHCVVVEFYNNYRLQYYRSIHRHPQTLNHCQSSYLRYHQSQILIELVDFILANRSGSLSAVKSSAASSAAYRFFFLFFFFFVFFYFNYIYTCTSILKNKAIRTIVRT